MDKKGESLPPSSIFKKAMMEATASCLADAEPSRRTTTNKQLPHEPHSQNQPSSSSDNAKITATGFYFKILMDDAKDRYDEAAKFFEDNSTYTCKFEFHIQILHDLEEELISQPPDLETEDYEKAVLLRCQLYDLRLNLVRLRNLFLKCEPTVTIDEVENIELPEGSQIYLEAAAEAKSARLRQFRIIYLLNTIKECHIEEKKYKTRRKHAESELSRYIGETMDESDVNEIVRDKFDLLSFASQTDRKVSVICLFCRSRAHPSHLCLNKSTLEERKQFYCDHNLCPLCGTSPNGLCSMADRWCEWPHCQAKNSHHSPLCPNIEYPITAEVVQAYERRINDLKRIQNRGSHWRN